MDIKLKPGKYVVAVSGGVDSVVLLDLLSKQVNVELIVGHFDHGIRPDSHKDCEFVAELAGKYGLPFEFAEGRLGPNVSEAMAREARYKFLKSVVKKYQADAIVMAHHQDDVLETAIINLLRGTGRRGLSSLKSTSEIKRPLLKFSKAEIKGYAEKNNLDWHEDPTNRDEKYLRNYVRHQIVAKITAAQRRQFLNIIIDTSIRNLKIDSELDKLLSSEDLDRQWFASLPHDIAKEVMLSWLRASKIQDLSRTLIENLVIKSKTYKINSQIDVNKLYIIKVTNKHLALGLRDR